jgi:hypothetical protein
LLGKLALDRTTSAQATLLFSVAAAIVSAVAIRCLGGAPLLLARALWLARLSGLCGAVGLVTFSLAL